MKVGGRHIVGLSYKSKRGNWKGYDKDTLYTYMERLKNE